MNKKRLGIIFLCATVAVVLLANLSIIFRHRHTEIPRQRYNVEHLRQLRIDDIKAIHLVWVGQRKRVTLTPVADMPEIQLLYKEFAKGRLWVDSRERRCPDNFDRIAVDTEPVGRIYLQDCRFDYKPPYLSRSLRSYTLGRICMDIIERKTRK